MDEKKAVDSSYNPKTTAAKIAMPLSVILVSEFAFFVLKLSGHEMPKDTIYQLAIAGYAGVVGVVNYFKNRKK